MKTALLTLLILLLTACGADSAPAERDRDSNNPAVVAGKALFEQPLMGKQPGCITCHSLEEGKQVIGPSLAGIATTTRVDGQSAEEYLRLSIQKPDDFVVEGFTKGTMSPAIIDELSAEDVDHLVAYLLTLE